MKNEFFLEKLIYKSISTSEYAYCLNELILKLNKSFSMDFAIDLYNELAYKYFELKSTNLYDIVDSKNSNQMVLLYYLSPFGLKNNKENFKKGLLLAKNFFDELIEEEAEIKDNDIIDILRLEHIERYLSYIKHKTKNLMILTFKSSFKEVNAYAFCHANMICIAPSNKEIDFRYILLHEIGHLLNIAITNANKVPDDFIPIFQKSFNNYNEVPIEDMLEIYADCFSIAMMNNTQYKNLNPFIKEFSKESVALITDYFSSKLI